ncbi:MAG: hypothetical protein R2834_01370 [Rhodothermales bacterium]
MPLRCTRPSFAGLILLLALWLSASPVAGQPLREGPASAALGGAATALSGDVWGVANPAAWAGLAGVHAAVVASEGYGLSALRSGGSVFAMPVGLAHVTASGATFGDKVYRETAWSLGVARPLFPGTRRAVDVGARLTLYHLGIDGYGAARAIGLAIGWQADIGPALRLGAAAENLNGPSWIRGEPLPRRLSAGIAYTPRDGPVRLLLAMKMTSRTASALHAGVAWRPLAALELRGGAGGSPLRLSGGFAVRAPWICIEAAAEHHELLGWTPSLAIHLTRRGAK